MQKVIWITGASSGIGAALAQFYLQRGDLVALSARHAESLQDIAKNHKNAFIAVCDVTDCESIKTAVSGIIEHFGRIDVAVLNAGTHIPVSLNDFKTETFQKLMDVNLIGVVRCIESILPHFKAQQSGHLAVVSSVAGLVGLPSSSAYGATKAGLINMIEALTPELRTAGIDVSLIQPGFVKTPLTDRNEFPMPMQITAQQAAQSIAKGLDKKQFLIRPPWLFGKLVRFLSLLPYPILFAITKKMVK